MSDPKMIKEIQSGQHSSDMARSESGIWFEAQILEALRLTISMRVEVLSPADDRFQWTRKNSKFLCLWS